MALKKVLVFGASGAMGRYLIPLLAQKGFLIDAVSLDQQEYDFPNVRGISGNAKDIPFRESLLKNNYDGIIDFMTYPSYELVPFLPWIVKSTGHYIYLSSYRVYDNLEVPIRETSPRLIDSRKDVFLQNSDDYCIFKARGENILYGMTEKNWTIVRPAITYSLLRYQLVTLETANTVGRAQLGKTVVLPESAFGVRSTMTWAGDAAAMIAKLLFNEQAAGETFTVSTAENHTWGEIAEYYHDICGLKALWVDQTDFLRCAVSGFDTFPITGSWQLVYDRLFERVIDNSKVLEATGMTQSELRKLYDGLELEIARCPADYGMSVINNSANIRMDEYLKNSGLN